MKDSSFLGRHLTAAHEHLRQPGLRRAVDRVLHRTDRQPGVADNAVELGAGPASSSQDLHLGGTYPRHGPTVGLGVFLVHDWTPGRLCRCHCMDHPGRFQFGKNLPLDLPELAVNLQ